MKQVFSKVKEFCKEHKYDILETVAIFGVTVADCCICYYVGMSRGLGIGRVLGNAEVIAKSTSVTITTKEV